MTSRLLVASLTSFVVLLPGPAVPQAQGSDVTFSVPLNLTHLSPDIAKVEVLCTIVSSALPKRNAQAGTVLTGQQDFVVSGGQVVTTATVVVAVTGLINPVGQNAGYKCLLQGFSTALQDWRFFDPASPMVAFRLSPAPVNLTGTFAW